MDPPSEPFAQTPPPHGDLRRVRSTLLVASRRMVDELGRTADYRAALDPRYQGTLDTLLAGTWIDVDASVAHYRACDALGLTEATLLDVGRSVGQRIRETVGNAFITLSREAGVTPWQFLSTIPRVWARIFEGSSLLIWKLGPKEARIDAAGSPLLDSRYFRNALRGQCMGGADLFCQRTYVTPRPGSYAPGTWAMRVQWA